MAARNNDYNGKNEELSADESRDNALHKIRTAGSISIPPELFEKLYLTPQTQVKGDLRKTFGNPTPLGLGGFLLALTPLTCDLMGWRGIPAPLGKGMSDIGAYYFFGGILLLVAAILEFILGNTYIFVVFGTFSAFWMTFAAVLQPSFAAYASYSPNPTGNPTAGLVSPAFNNSIGFFLIFMGVLTVLYLICALRTNVVLVLILFPLPFAFAFLTAAFWYGAQGQVSYSTKMQKAGGACVFATCMFGWYLFSALMLASLDFPFSLPVGDLSTKIKGASERAAEAQA